MSANIERSIGRLEGKIDGMSVDIQNINQSMTNLKSAFDVLEQGRLSGLEVNFATLKTQVKERAKTTATLYASVISGVVSIISALVVFYFIKK